MQDDEQPSRKHQLVLTVLACLTQIVFNLLFVTQEVNITDQYYDYGTAADIFIQAPQLK
jgi:hypothetical protein